MNDDSERPPRLVPDASFPRYSYVPGRFPHPRRDPDGHSYGSPEPVAERFTGHGWRESTPYRLGIDLFNHGFYWEAHEQWEALWHAFGRQGAEATMLKGLIKLAAAGVKLREGRVEGIRRHAARAAELFALAGMMHNRSCLLGLDIESLIAAAQAIAASDFDREAQASSFLPLVIVFK